jgi:hypothetical protein
MEKISVSHLLDTLYVDELKDIAFNLNLENLSLIALISNSNTGAKWLDIRASH